MATGYLNEDMNWAQLPPYVHAAFTNGNAEKVLITPGFALCKLSDFATINAPGSMAVSPWWSPLEPY